MDTDPGVGTDPRTTPLQSWNENDNDPNPALDTEVEEAPREPVTRTDVTDADLRTGKDNNKDKDKDAGPPGDDPNNKVPLTNH